MVDDGDDKDDSKRRTRNLSEKKRRDQFNMLVNELSTMVSTNNRKMDKSTVLKSTISFLKNHNDITVRSRAHDVQEDWKPAFLSNEEFTYLVLEALEGFIIVFSANGTIHYVSDSITSLLGHNASEILHQSVFDLAHEDDQPHLYSLLQSVDPVQVGHMKDNIIKFECHIKRGSSQYGNKVLYERIQFYGHIRTNYPQNDQDDRSFQQDPEFRMLFVCSGRLQTPHLIRDVSLMDLSRNEFTSRHSLEWKFLFLDHRAPPIIGYLPFEVLGTSGYDYYHFDDLEKVVDSHKALMQKGELTSCYYRFLTKGQQWIWLQTRYYITYHQWSSKPEFVVCTHRVVSYADMNDMKQEAPQEAPDDSTSTNDVAMPMADENMSAVSPSCVSENSDAYMTNYAPMSKSASVKSASVGSTAGTSITLSTLAPGGWGARYQLRPSSDTGSVSGDSRGSYRNSSVTEDNPGMLNQHSIGAQGLDPTPYSVSAVSAIGAICTVGAVTGSAPGSLAVTGVTNVMPGVSGVLQLQPVQLIVPTEQTQEQLQRKHEELQQMIVQQQAELRQVKEQLLLARLGILPPLVNIHGAYINPEDMQAGVIPAVYEPPVRPQIAAYPHQPPNPPQHPQ